jgi:hypothetical protein
MSEQAQAREEMLTRLEQQQAEIAEQIRLLREQLDQATESQITEEQHELWLQHQDAATKILEAGTALLTFINTATLAGAFPTAE